MLRALWVIIALLIVGWTVVNNIWSGLGVESAFQASQLADETGATMLTLMCVTVLFWFLADRRAQAPGPTEQELLGGGQWRRCSHCAELVRAQAHVCRYCGRDLGEAAAPSSGASGSSSGGGAIGPIFAPLPDTEVKETTKKRGFLD